MLFCRDRGNAIPLCLCSVSLIFLVPSFRCQLVTDLKGKDVVQIGCGLQHTVALTRYAASAVDAY